MAARFAAAELLGFARRAGARRLRQREGALVILFLQRKLDRGIEQLPRFIERRDRPLFGACGALFVERREAAVQRGARLARSGPTTILACASRRFNCAMRRRSRALLHEFDGLRWRPRRRPPDRVRRGRSLSVAAPLTSTRLRNAGSGTRARCSRASRSAALRPRRRDSSARAIDARCARASAIAASRPPLASDSQRGILDRQRRFRALEANRRARP